MNSDTGGLSPSERQRQAAAAIARKKTLAAYSSYQPRGNENAATQNAANASVNAQNTDWKRYHSAWQNYYQKYYSDYYSKAAREFVAGERHKLAQEKAALAATERRQKETASRLAAERAMTEAKHAALKKAQNTFIIPAASPQSAASSRPAVSSRPATPSPSPTRPYSATQPRPTTSQSSVATPPSSANTQPTPLTDTLSQILPDQHSDEDKGIFIRRLKARAAQKASASEKTKARRRRLLPIAAGLAVMLIILFLQYNRLIFAPIAAYVSPGDIPSSEISAIDPTITSNVSADPKLIIPSLNVEVPVAFNIPLSEVDAAMSNGVAQFRIQGASALPGEIGNLVISGHSAGDIYSNNQYKFIFSGLERLSVGDLIYINYNSTRYTYRMTSSAVVEPTDIAALTGETDKPQLILVTCTPLGTSRYRLLIYAEQISPSYTDATESTDPTDTGNSTTSDMPQNEPTLFENIWNWLTGN